MKKLLETLEDVLPVVWGVLWIIIITFGSFGLAVLMFTWVLRLVEVL